MSRITAVPWCARPMETNEEAGAETAMTWLAVQAWFESALDPGAEPIRHLGA